MPLPKHRLPDKKELELQALRDEEGRYVFDPDNTRPVYSIDIPPPTISGNLHLGHSYSYTLFARFHRVCGENVFYLKGYEDNGLPQRAIPSWNQVKSTPIWIPGLES